MKQAPEHARSQIEKLRKIADDAEDKTDEIRKLKQSVVIKKELPDLMKVVDKHYGRVSLPELRNMAEMAAPELAKMHVMLFAKIVKREIRPAIVDAFISTLEDIEAGKINQKDASHVIGGLLKSEYIDPAVQKANASNALAQDTDEQTSESVHTPVANTTKNISWKEYKDKKATITKNVQTQMILNNFK